MPINFILKITKIEEPIKLFKKCIKIPAQILNNPIITIIVYKKIIDFNSQINSNWYVWYEIEKIFLKATKWTLTNNKNYVWRSYESLQFPIKNIILINIDWTLWLCHFGRRITLASHLLFHLLWPSKEVHFLKYWRGFSWTLVVFLMLEFL